MNWNDIKNISKRRMAEKKATDVMIRRTNDLLQKYYTAKEAKEKPAPVVGSDPCLRSLRRHLQAAKQAAEGPDILQRVGKLIHGFIDRNPALKVANIIADRNYREQKARETTIETRKGQPEKPDTNALKGQAHAEEGRSVTFGDGRTVTFKSASERQEWLASKVNDFYARKRAEDIVSPPAPAPAPAPVKAPAPAATRKPVSPLSVAKTIGKSIRTAAGIYGQAQTLADAVPTEERQVVGKWAGRGLDKAQQVLNQKLSSPEDRIFNQAGNNAIDKIRGRVEAWRAKQPVK